MRNALFTSLLLLGTATPCLARAEQSAAAPANGRASGWVIQPGQWVAVGAGVVAGAVVMEVLVPTRLVYLLGSVAGGYLASTWYDGRRVEIHTVP
jgi:hypothetical protein